MAAAASIPEQIRRLTPLAAPAGERRDIQKLADALSDLSSAPRRSTAPKCMLVGPKGEELPLPPALFHVLARVADVLARGGAVTIAPTRQEVTTQQAADILNISRQYLVRLLEEQRIPFRKTGKHRRLRIDDVLRYKRERETERGNQLRALTELTGELGGYDKELR